MSSGSPFEKKASLPQALEQALQGLNYLPHGWLHCDIKASNMLVDEDGTVLVGDFGVGVCLGELTSVNQGLVLWGRGVSRQGRRALSFEG